MAWTEEKVLLVLGLVSVVLVSVVLVSVTLVSVMVSVMMVSVMIVVGWRLVVRRCVRRTGACDSWGKWKRAMGRQSLLESCSG